NERVAFQPADVIVLRLLDRDGSGLVRLEILVCLYDAVIRLSREDVVDLDTVAGRDIAINDDQIERDV
ncbi:MAG: hypothetical protein VST67_14860, partial [Nitrospirota bacterium]|nr:hypothetical protein [Nitrospirota bacterium]